MMERTTMVPDKMVSWRFRSSGALWLPTIDIRDTVRRRMNW